MSNRSALRFHRAARSSRARGALAVFALALALPATAQTHYTVIDLGTLGSGRSEGYALNASGRVAGLAKSPVDGFTHAVRWTGAAPVDLGTLGAPSSCGLGINASGQVVGTSHLA